MREIQGRIMKALSEAKKPLGLDAFKNEEKKELAEAVSDLLNEAKIVYTKKQKLALPEHMGLVYGQISGHARGFGFFTPKAGGQDAFIPADSMHGAIHRDMVWVRYGDTVSRNGSAEAEVALITKRGFTEIVGTFEMYRNNACYVVPIDARISCDVLIPDDKMKKSRSGDRVVARITQYPDGRRPMLGRIEEIIGPKDDAATDVTCVIRQLGLKEVFRKTALRAAKAVEKSVPEDEALTRESLTDKTIFTIDGADAKDLDDAVSIERLKNGNFYLGVHIADVAHYVKEASPLDKEAEERGTSVYLADRVLPMLPTELSNGICSLNPMEERLTLSCFMEIDENGRVVRHRLAETIIKSTHRLVYDDISALLNGDKELQQKYADIADNLRELESLTKVLNAARVKRGSIDFDIAQAHIELSEKGQVIGVEREQRGIANRIIEECMLIANETVATHMNAIDCPFIYRVHDKPNKDKLSELNAFLQTLGYSFRNISDIKPRAIQRVLNAAKGKEEENVVSKVVLRSMQKAKYSECCTGHFGLAADKYCHFTSPIRRYPDLMCHRIVKHMLRGEYKAIKKLSARLPAAALSSSIREREAMEAERAVDDIKKCEYAKGHIGESFDALISGVSRFGFFVELHNTVEGLIRLHTIEGDIYKPDLGNYRIVGRNTGKTFRLGDKIRVKLVAVNQAARNIDFELE